MAAKADFNGGPRVFARLANAVPVVVPCGGAVLTHVQQISSLATSQRVPVGSGGVTRGQRGAIILMIEGSHLVNTLDALFASSDSAILAGFIPADDGILSTPQERIVV
jgi:hypothetical protein